MAHYAFLDDENLVTEVIVGRDEDDLAEGVTSWEDYYGAVRGQRCLQTSYNTQGGAHLTGGTPFRKNYAGIGFTYDKDRDAFIPPKPYDSWVLNEETCLWESSVPYPENSEGIYQWNESTQSWDEVSQP